MDGWKGGRESSLKRTNIHVSAAKPSSGLRQPSLYKAEIHRTATITITSKEKQTKENNKKKIKTKAQSYSYFFFIHMYNVLGEKQLLNETKSDDAPALRFSAVDRRLRSVRGALPELRSAAFYRRNIRPEAPLPPRRCTFPDSDKLLKSCYKLLTLPLMRFLHHFLLYVRDRIACFV